MVGLIWLIIQGCGAPSLVSDIEEDWRTQVQSDRLGTIQFMEESNRIIIGNDNDIYILNKEDGSVIHSMEESFWERIRPDIEVGGITFDGAISDAYTLIPHHDTNSMLLFDYRFDEETVTALDITTGEEKWQNSQHNYSLAQYSDFLDIAEEAAGRALASAFGGQATGGRTTAEQRRSQVEFMNSIYFEIPGSDNFVIKTLDGIALFDGNDGTLQWEIDDFQGPGMTGLEVLPDGDLIVLSSGRNLRDFEIASEYHLARISQDGEVRWISEHNGSHTQELFVGDNHVVVDAAPTEIFDLETGEKLWESDAVYRQHRFYNILITGDRMFVAGDLENQTVTLGHRGWVWEYDLDTGEVLWKTEETRTEFTYITRYDDIVMAKGDGSLFGGNGGVIAIDINTGEELWKTPEMSSFGMTFREWANRGHKVTDPLIYDEIVYVAGPDNIYAIDLYSGELIFEDEHDERGTDGTTRNLLMHDDNVYLVGVNAIIAYDRHDGSVVHEIKTEENASAYAAFDNHIIITDTNKRAGAFDLESTELGPMFRAENTHGGRFGNMSNGFYLSENGEHLFVLRGGYIYRYTLI